MTRLAPLQTMRGVIDRFKAMDRFCFVEGDMNGALTLRVENDRYALSRPYCDAMQRNAPLKRHAMHDPLS